MRRTILSAFEQLPYFTMEGFRQLAGEAITGDQAARMALYRWAKAGYIIPLKRGLYMHRGFFEQHRRETEFSPLVSAILLPQSYLSLEYVLQEHGVLTEVTYPVTAVTLKNTRTILSPLGTFVYRHIRPSLYLGFQISEAFGVPVSQASPAKALFDYLYLRPLASTARRYDLAEELRLNLDDFSQAERDEFAGYVAASELPKMATILHNLESGVWRL
jgi:hypothetical protein